MEKKAEAYKKYNGAAMAEMMLKIMPQMAAEIAKPLSQIDKINIVVPFGLPYIDVRGFRDGRASVKDSSGKWGVIDTNGNLIVFFRSPQIKAGIRAWAWTTSGCSFFMISRSRKYDFIMLSGFLVFRGTL